MDPYTRNETLLLAFNSHIYEPLVRRDRNMEPEPALAERWEQPSPTLWRFHLRRGVKFTDGTPFTADDVVFSAQRVRAQGSNLNVGAGHREGGAEGRRPHGGVRDHRAEPDPATRRFTTFGIMSQAVVGEEQRHAPRRPDHARGELRHPQRHGHRPLPPGQPRARPPHRAGAEPGLVGQADAQPPARRVHHHRQRRDARRGAALGRDRLRLHRAAAGRGPHPPHRRACR